VKKASSSVDNSARGRVGGSLAIEKAICSLLPLPHSQAVVDRVKAETGLDCAVVDVNDKSHYMGLCIVAATSKSLHAVLERALIDNPTGNAIEQTPLVLIRPTPATT
jgi:hypothetical protein